MERSRGTKVLIVCAALVAVFLATATVSIGNAGGESTSERLAKLSARLASVEQVVGVAAEERVFDPVLPRLKEVEKGLAELTKKTAKAVVPGSSTSPGVDLERQLSESRRHRERLDERLSRLDRDSQDISRVANEFRQIKSDLQRAKENIEKLERRVRKLESNR